MYRIINNCVWSVHTCSIYRLSNSQGALERPFNYADKFNTTNWSFIRRRRPTFKCLFQVQIECLFSLTFFDYFSHYFLAPCHVLHFFCSASITVELLEKCYFSNNQVLKNVCFQRFCQYIHGFISCYFVCCIGLVLIIRYLSHSLSRFDSFSPSLPL